VTKLHFFSSVSLSSFIYVYIIVFFKEKDSDILIIDSH